MKKLKTLMLGSVASALLAMAPNASALAIDDANYVGRITPGTPANEAAEATYAQYLIDLFNGVETDTSSVSFAGFPTAQSFTVNTSAPKPPGSLPDFGPAGTHLLNGAGVLDVSGTYNITGALYIYAYYGNGAVDPNGPGSGDDGQLWYVGNLSGNVSIPTKGLSHVTIAGGTTVPDAGTTLVLLGGSLIGLGALRRRFSK